MMDLTDATGNTEKAAIVEAAEKVNEAVEELLKSVDAAIEPDAEHVVETSNDQIYLPEAAETAPLSSHTGPITPTGTDETDPQINFAAPSVLRKWPSLAKERVTTSLYGPYLVADGTLDECMRQFISKPASQHHLYEIHTAPQSDLVGAVLSAEHIVELARLREFL
jgi:hypothetical protein